MNSLLKQARMLSLVVLLVALCFEGYSQNTINWVQGNKGKTDYLLKAVATDGESIFSGVMVGGLMKPSKGGRLQIFSPDLQLNGDVPIQGCNIANTEMGEFNNAIWYKELPMASGGPGSGNKLAFVGKDGNVISQPELDPSYKYHIVTGNIAMAVINNDYSNIKVRSNTGQTSDMEHFVIWGYKDESGSKKADKPHSIKVYIIDNTFKVVRTETFDIEETFGQDAVINTLRFDLSPKDELLVFVNFHKKPGKTHFKMANIPVQGDKPTVYDYQLSYETPAYEWTFDESGNVYISGTVGVGDFIPSVKKNTNRMLFFIPQSLASKTPAKIVTYELNTEFYAKYPEFAKGRYLARDLTYPYFLFKMNDGLLYMSENAEKVTHYSSTTNTSSSSFNAFSFTFIKFDLQGNIKWIKMLTKQVTVKSGYESLLDFSVFPDEDAISIIYTDAPLNVSRPAGKLVAAKSTATLGTVVARVNGSGDIKQQVINNPVKSKIFAQPMIVSLVNERKCVIAGYKYKPLSLPDYYFGTFDLFE
jgi:hypothetical protein